MGDRISRRQMLERCAAMGSGAVIADCAESARGPVAACLAGGRIRWIVGWTPGGGFDIYSRLAAPFVEKMLGAQIAIDNVPGAGGLVGALTISRARPDGRTLGILNGAGLLWQRTPDPGAPLSLERDFTVLARVSRRQQVIVANAGSSVTTMGDLIALSNRRAIVAGITAPDSSSFASIAVVSELFGLSTEYVSGYPGSREVILGLLRGDCDITAVDIEAFLEVPDIRSANPLLQITSEQPPDQGIAGVPHLAGAAGLIATRPEWFPGGPERARPLVTAMAAHLDFGRLFAGPRGIAPSLRDCLEQGLHAALSDPGFAAAARRAGRTISVATGAEVRRALPAAALAVRPMDRVCATAAGRIR